MRQQARGDVRENGLNALRNGWAWIGMGAAIISLFIYGGTISAFLFLIAAFMGWSSAFARIKAQGKATLGTKGRIAVGSLMTLFAVLAIPKGGQAGNDASDSPLADSAAIQCDHSSQSTGIDYAANEYERVLTAPGRGAPPVQRTIGEQTAPLTIEKGETIREHCRAGQWSKVHIPASDHVPRLSGWVPSSALSKVTTTEDGRRLYNQSDFVWPRGTGSDKAAVVKVINRIMDERRECETISQRHLVFNKATRTFSIPCHAGTEMISFDFTAADAANGRSFAKVEPMTQADAIAACRDAVRQNAAHPSTVEFPWLDYDFIEGAEGRTDVRTSASAKNAFGLTLRFKVWCEFRGAELKNFGMEEDAR